MSNSISFRKRQKVFSKTNYKCAYCGKALNMQIEPDSFSCDYAIDHVVPKSKGGTNALENLLPCCKSCNSSKGTKSLEAFRCYLTLKAYGIPLFTKQQIDFLRTKVDIKQVFPDKVKFYFETLKEYDKNDNLKALSK